MSIPIANSAENVYDMVQYKTVLGVFIVSVSYFDIAAWHVQSGTTVCTHGRDLL